MQRQLLLTFKNTHAVMEASEILREAELEHEVVARPVKLAAECGIAVLLPVEFEGQALPALEAGGYPPARVYEQEEASEDAWRPRSES